MANPLLSILCVTQGQPYALPFLDKMCDLAGQLMSAEVVIGVDDHANSEFGVMIDVNRPVTFRAVRSRGFIESVLDEMVAECKGEFILRLDDDECCSPAMIEWLTRGDYLAHDHWCFPRAHMWPDPDHVLIAPQLYPDYQTRLSIKQKSGGRPFIHSMSPFGMGEPAPVYIEHHKFLVRSRAEREETARRWHSGGMTAFSLPEDVLQVVKVISKGDGQVPWTPDHVTECEMSAVTR